VRQTTGDGETTDEDRRFGYSVENPDRQNGPTATKERGTSTSSHQTQILIHGHTTREHARVHTNDVTSHDHVERCLHGRKTSPAVPNTDVVSSRRW